MGARAFLEDRQLPSVAEGNSMEPLVGSWLPGPRIIVGARWGTATESLADAYVDERLTHYASNNFVVLWRAPTAFSRGRVYVVLNEDASDADALEGVFNAVLSTHSTSPSAARESYLRFREAAVSAGWDVSRVVGVERWRAKWTHTATDD